MCPTHHSMAIDADTPPSLPVDAKGHGDGMVEVLSAIRRHQLEHTVVMAEYSLKMYLAMPSPSRRVNCHHCDAEIAPYATMVVIPGGPGGVLREYCSMRCALLSVLDECEACSNMRVPYTGALQCREITK